MNGVQILPTDHIYYAKITNLPTIPNEATILRQITSNPGPYVGSGMRPVASLHNNLLDNTMPATPMTFLYTGAKGVINFNGPYQFMSGNNPGSPLPPLFGQPRSGRIPYLGWTGLALEVKARRDNALEVGPGQY